MALFNLPFFRKAAASTRPRIGSAFLRNLQSPLLFAWNPALREPLDE